MGFGHAFPECRIHQPNPSTWGLGGPWFGSYPSQRAKRGIVVSPFVPRPPRAPSARVNGCLPHLGRPISLGVSHLEIWAPRSSCLWSGPVYFSVPGLPHLQREGHQGNTCPPRPTPGLSVLAAAGFFSSRFDVYDLKDSVGPSASKYSLGKEKPAELLWAGPVCGCWALPSFPHHRAQLLASRASAAFSGVEDAVIAFVISSSHFLWACLERQIMMAGEVSED